MNKTVEVQGFSLYWDVGATMVSVFSRDEIEASLFCLSAFHIVLDVQLLIGIL